MMLGIFGEYLGRMYMERKRRPLFIIDEVRAGPRGIVAEASVREMPAMPRAING